MRNYEVYEDEYEDGTCNEVNGFGCRPISKRKMKELTEIIIKLNPVIKQIIILKPDRNIIFSQSLVVFVDTDDVYCEYKILKKIISKLSDYYLTTYVFGRNEVLPIKLKSILATQNAECVYGQGCREFTLTKEIVDYIVTEAEKKRIHSSTIFVDRNKESRGFNQFPNPRVFANIESNVELAFSELANSIEKLFLICKSTTNNSALKKMYDTIKYMCSEKYCGFKSLYTLEEREKAYGEVEKLAASFLETASNELKKAITK